LFFSCSRCRTVFAVVFFFSSVFSFQSAFLTSLFPLPPRLVSASARAPGCNRGHRVFFFSPMAFFSLFSFHNGCGSDLKPQPVTCLFFYVMGVDVVALSCCPTIESPVLLPRMLRLNERTVVFLALVLPTFRAPSRSGFPPGGTDVVLIFHYFPFRGRAFYVFCSFFFLPFFLTLLRGGLACVWLHITTD